MQVFNRVVQKDFDKEECMNKKLTLAVAATALAGLMALASPGRAQTTVTAFAPFTLTPTAGVWFKSDVRTGGNASIVDLTGVGGNLETNQPLPIGAAKLTTDSTNAAKAEVAVTNDFGVLNNIIGALAVGYSWHKAANPGQNPNAAPSLKLTFYNPICDETPGLDCFATLVYEPYTNGFGNFPTQDLWQRSDLDASTGTWWTTGGFGFLNGAGGCPCMTLTDWITFSTPDFGQANLIAVSVGVGSFNPGQIGYFDKVTISGTLADAVYDFEDLGPCSLNVDIPNTTLTLLANCVTDHTLLVPDDWTLDGDGFSITAVDPVAGHFLGAIIKNDGATAYVTNLVVTALGLANVCDGGDDRLRGILFDGAAGSISNNTVVNINQGASGCQEGNGIEVRHAPFDNTGTDLAVAITGNVVSGYQKNGITANGSVAATISGNVVTGAGPVTYIAQNGIQIGFGATATVQGNTVSGNNYTPKDTTACGLLLFQSDGVRTGKNVFTGNEKDLCNFGRGGGSANPVP